MSTNVGIFVLAALFELAGCFAFWLWIRRGAAAYVAVLGVVSLVGFAFTLTRVGSTFAGRHTPLMAGYTSLRRSSGCGWPKGSALRCPI